MSPRCHERRLAAVLTLVLSLSPAVLAAQGAYVEGGLAFSTGDYGYTQRTDSAAFSLGVAWSSRRLTVRATLPWFVRENGPQPQTAAAPGADASSFVSESAGWAGSVGDPYLQLTVGAIRDTRTSVSLGVSTKVPVLAPGEFGTGGWDFGGSVSASRSVGSSTLLGFDGSYWHLADPPNLELQDTVMGTLTVARSLGARWSASLSVSGSRSAVPGYAHPWWCSMLLGRSFSRGIWGVTAMAGLGGTAPDFGLGIIWRLRLP